MTLVNLSHEDEVLYRYLRKGSPVYVKATPTRRGVVTQRGQEMVEVRLQGSNWTGHSWYRIDEVDLADGE